MADKDLLQYIHRRPRRRAKPVEPSESQPEPTGAHGSLSGRGVSREPARRQAPRHRNELPAEAAPEQPSPDWRPRNDICDRLNIPPGELYRRVVRGDVRFTTDNYRVVYQADQRPTVFAAGTRPGDTLELALHEPPDPELVGSLAALADGLSDRYAELAQASRVVSQRREEAVRRLESTAAKLASLREENLALSERLRQCELTREQAQQGLQRWNDHAMKLQQTVSNARATLARLANSPDAYKIRSSLIALLDELC